MSRLPVGSDMFKTLGAICRAWGETSQNVARDFSLARSSDQNTFAMHRARLGDTDTLLTLGYVKRAEEKTGEPVMQATIVSALAPDQDTPDPDAQALNRTRKAAVRQDIKRRSETLAFFGLIDRRQVTKTAVQLRMTEYGRRVAIDLDILFGMEKLELASERRSIDHDR